jgi:hydroxypyruvate isomerase
MPAMLRFAANVSMLFAEAPFLERFALAARAGFAAVECQFPYEAPAAEIRARLDDLGLAMVLHNLPAGDWAAGERGLACLPDRVDEFRAGVTRAIAYAHALGVTQLNCLAGIAPPGADAGALRRTLVDNLRFAARALAAEGLRLLVEPINTFDVPGFFVNRTAQCVALLDEVGEPGVFVQYDAYHMQRMEGELAATLAQELLVDDAEVAAGRVRPDLYYRLAVFPIRIPALRERTDDIPLLVRHFLAHFQRKLAKSLKGVTPESMRRLSEYSWPGNIRELQNVMERACVLARGPIVDVGTALGGSDRPATDAAPAVDDRLLTLDEHEQAQIRRALSIAAGKIHGPGGAAELLGINASTLRSRMEKHGMSKN